VAATHPLPDPQRPRITPDTPVPFTQVPEPIWTDPSVKCFDRTLLGYLISWMWRHPGRFPEMWEIRRDLGKKQSGTITASMDRLERAGYLRITRRGRGNRYQAKLGYTLCTPGPRAPRQMTEEPRLPFHLEPEEKREKSRSEARKIALRSAKNRASQSPPPGPPYKEERDKEQPETVVVVDKPHLELPGEPADNQDEFLDLLRRSQELTPTSEEDLRVALGVFTTDQLDAAVTTLELARRVRGRSVPNFRYILGTAENLMKEAAAQTVQDQPLKRCPDFNRNPVPKYDPPPPPPTLGEIAEAFELAKTPGIAGHIWERRIGIWRKTGVLPAESDACTEAQEKPAESPPTTVSPQPAGSPNPIGPLNYTAGRDRRKIERPHGQGQRARQDLNLQPSDSKAESCKALCDNTIGSSGEEATIEMKIPRQGSALQAAPCSRARLPAETSPFPSQA